MTIEKIISGDTTTLKLSGRLDTTSAPSLEESVNECIAGVKELTLDCENLKYVSSAGLRVILKAEKIMKSQGFMKLTNVNDAIMEVFDITGFVDILTIE